MKRNKIASYPWYLMVGAVSLALSACLVDLFEPRDPDPDPTPDPVDLSLALQAATPESQGFNAERLTRAYARARDIPKLRSLLVLRNGELVAEQYFGETRQEDDARLWGATNAVISALVGIAIEQELIEGENQQISELLPAELFAISALHEEITVKHLLTMSSGQKWQEVDDGPEFRQWIDSGDHVNYFLGKPLATNPGAVHNYNSGAAHLLSVILSQASGMSTLEFAQENLFGPLGVGVPHWHVDSGGFHFAHGLYLRPRDLAKLGVLLTQNGFDGNDQVVPAEWIRRAYRPQLPVHFSFSTLHGLDYGYLWWVEGRDVNQAFLAWGYAGQFLYLVPDRNLVVVTTADWRQLSYDEVRAQEKAILDLVGNLIIPAVRPITAFLDK